MEGKKKVETIRHLSKKKTGKFIQPFFLMNQTPTCNVAFIGDIAVGKTSLLCRVVKGEFDENQQSTIAFNNLTMVAEDKEKTCLIKLFDTAGQERFESLAMGVVRDAKIVIIVFSCESRESFQKAKSWYETAKELKENTIFYLIENKCDLENHVISDEEFEALAKEIGASHFLATSAKNGENVQALKDLITEDSLKFCEQESKIIERDVKEKKGCC